jgi:hypothetical protein
VKANNSEVICPGCTHQFRAIPVNVQKLLLGAGFEPPFTHPPAASSDEKDAKEKFEVYAFNMGYRDFEPDQDGNNGYRNPHIQSKWDFWKASRAAMKGREE